METEIKEQTEVLLFEILANISVAKDYQDVDRNIEKEMWELFLQTNELIFLCTDILPSEVKDNYMCNPREQVDFYCRDFLKTFKDRTDEINGWFNSAGDYNSAMNEILISDSKIKPDFFETDYLNTLTLADFALMTNKLYRYLGNVLDSYVSGSTYPVATSDYDIPAKTVQVLLMYYTGIFGHLVTMYKSNYTKVSEAMAAIVGGNPRTINRVFNFISNKNSQHRNNPYTNKEIVETLIEKLSLLEIDTKELENILFKLK